MLKLVYTKNKIVVGLVGLLYLNIFQLLYFKTVQLLYFNTVHCTNIKDS